MSNDSFQSAFEQPGVKTMANAVKKARPVPLILRLIRLGFRLGGTLAPKLAGRVAYNMWFTPTRFPTPASEQEALHSADIAFRNINGLNIATYSWGQSGPVVLLVHGWSGRGTQLGAFAQPLVDSGYRVLSFDCPAHGNSSGKQTTLYEIADVMLALDDVYGPFESVITHSFGGPCMAVAIQRGLNTASVVSLSPPARIAGLVRTFAHTLSIPEKAEKDFIGRFEQNFGKNVLQETSMETNVRDLDMPGLVIHDEDDADVDWHEGQAVAQAWKNAGFIKTSMLGHRRILRDAQTIQTAVDFIKTKKF